MGGGQLQHTVAAHLDARGRAGRVPPRLPTMGCRDCPLPEQQGAPLLIVPTRRCLRCCVVRYRQVGRRGTTRPGCPCERGERETRAGERAAPVDCGCVRCSAGERARGVRRRKR
eukprot:251863-Chlamydomonas_euryale.AAC.6